MQLGAPPLLARLERQPTPVELRPPVELVPPEAESLGAAAERRALLLPEVQRLDALEQQALPKMPQLGLQAASLGA